MHDSSKETASSLDLRIPKVKKTGTEGEHVRVITPYRVLILCLVILSVGIGLVFNKLPEKVQYAMVFVVPALLVGGYVIVRPFAGVWMMIMMDYLRPYTIIPALLPLRLAMLTIGATLISWIIFAAARKERTRWHPLATGFLLYVTVIASTVLTAPNNFHAYRVFEGMATTFVMFFLTFNITRSIKSLYTLIWLMLWIHGYYAVKGIYNFAFIGYMAGSMNTSGIVGTGFIADENDFALALITMIPFAFFMFQNQRSFIKKWFLIGLLLLLTLGVVASQSRGGWIGLVAVIAFCIAKSKRKLMSIAIIVVVCLAVALFAPASYWSEIESISQTDEGTAQTRINYWKTAVRMYKDHPVTGVGAGNGPLQMPNYAIGFRDANTQWGRTFHGTLPLVLAETGTLGMLAYLMMIYIAFRNLIRIQKRFKREANSHEWTLASSIAGSIFGYFVTATFLSTAYYPQLWTLYSFTAALALTIDSTDRGEGGPLSNDAALG